MRSEPRLKWTIISLGIFGAAMFYGDSMITPAITVLSAIGGPGDRDPPAFTPYVIPIATRVILAGSS